MNLSGFSGIIKTMFSDRMSIRRYTTRTNSDQTTDSVLSSTDLYSNIPCRLSYNSDESPKDRDVDNVPVQLVPKVFCGVEVDIKPGDLVTVTRFNDSGNIIATFSGTIGLPSVFITHKEALFLIDRSA